MSRTLSYQPSRLDRICNEIEANSRQQARKSNHLPTCSGVFSGDLLFADDSEEDQECGRSFVDVDDVIDGETVFEEKPRFADPRAAIDRKELWRLLRIESKGGVVSNDILKELDHESFLFFIKERDGLIEKAMQKIRLRAPLRKISQETGVPISKIKDYFPTLLQRSA